MAFWGHWPWGPAPEGDPAEGSLAAPLPATALPVIAPEEVPAAPADPPAAEALQRDEATLIAAARAGDEDAFGALAQRHFPSIFRLAFRIVRNQDDALEVAQDVLLLAWQAIDQFQGQARFATWLHTITYRRALRTIEARKQHGNALTRFAEEQMGRIGEAWSSLQANQAEQQWEHTINEQVEQLPLRYRQVLTLRHMHDLTYEEISQELSIPVSAVKTHLFRARKMLRERLEDLDQASLVAESQRTGSPLPNWPHVQLPHFSLPHVELPALPLQQLRDRLEAGASGLGEILRGHLRPSKP